MPKLAFFRTKHAKICAYFRVNFHFSDTRLCKIIGKYHAWTVIILKSYSNTMSVCLSYSAAVSWFPARGIHLVGLIGFKVFAGETLRLWADSNAMQPQLKVGSVRRGIPTAAKYTHMGKCANVQIVQCTFQIT